MLSFDELMGSLQTHEARLNKSVVKIDEKAFHVKGEASSECMYIFRLDMYTNVLTNRLI